MKEKTKTTKMDALTKNRITDMWKKEKRKQIERNILEVQAIVGKDDIQRTFDIFYIKNIRIV